MITSDLTYEEAEAILERLAGPSSWEHADLVPLTAALAQASSIKESRPAAVTRHAQPRSWSEKTFRSLVESSPDALVVFDQSGSVLLVNGQSERLFGYRREELLGLSIEFLIPELFAGRRSGESIVWPADAVDSMVGGKEGHHFAVEVVQPAGNGRRTAHQQHNSRHFVPETTGTGGTEISWEGIPAVTFMAALVKVAMSLYVSPQI